MFCKSIYPVFLLGLACIATWPSACADADADTWAVIVSSSRFWLNYRHTANAFGVYEAIKRLGIPDSNIILMIADCSSCDARNPRPGHLPGSPGTAAPSWHPPGAEIDYRGRDVSAATLLQVLSGRHLPGTPTSRRLNSHSNSSVLLYLTGHGGDGFLKFHDQEELLDNDLAETVANMHAAGRYRQLMIMLDTCQAASMYATVTAPNWIGISSSKVGQSSYALHSDATVGAHLVDEFTHHLVEFLEGLVVKRAASSASLKDLLRYISRKKMSSEIHVDASRLGREVSQVSVTEFFGGAGGRTPKQATHHAFTTMAGNLHTKSLTREQAAALSWAALGIVGSVQSEHADDTDDATERGREEVEAKHGCGDALPHCRSGQESPSLQELLLTALSEHVR